VRPYKVISGGQTGVDQGALAAALDCGIQIGGHVPRGFRTEAGDNTIPAWCAPFMTESRSAAYPLRTRLNVENSDATLVIVMRALRRSTGSQMTVNRAVNANKPLLIVEFELGIEENANIIAQWWHTLRPPTENYEGRVASATSQVLNVAGNRESRAYGMFDYSCALMVHAFNEMMRTT